MFQTTQTGRVLIVTFIIGIALLASSVIIRSRQWLKKYRVLHALVLVILGLMIANSYNLSITVDEENFHFQMWPGLLEKTISLSEIENCEAVQNKRRYGFGIRRIKWAWLYNVSGLQAVELTITGAEQKLRVGTFEPEKVCEAVVKS